MATVVSAISWYSLLQMLFLDQCIYIFLFSWLADAFQPVCHVQLHLHLAFSGTWGYFLRKFFICIPRFLWPADTSHWNCASSTCSFYALRILPSKLCILEILHLQSPKIHYRRYRRSISFAFYLLHGLSRYMTYKKIDIRNSSEYGTSVGDT